MFDSIKEFFKDVKERSSSPFFSSFIISWLIINWRIPIGLLFYKNSELAVDSYLSPIDLIEKNYCLGKSIIAPLIGACVYTIGFPYLKAQILLHNVRINKYRREKSQEITKTLSIPMSEFLELSEKREESEKQLREVLNDKSNYKEQRKSLEKERDDANLNRDAIKTTLQNYFDLQNPEILNGIWDYIDTTNNSNDESWKIESGTIVSFEGKVSNPFKDETGRPKNTYYIINDFNCNPKEKSISLVLVDQERQIHSMKLFYDNEDFTMLKGKLDINIQIGLIRRQRLSDRKS